MLTPQVVSLVECTLLGSCLVKRGSPVLIRTDKFLFWEARSVYKNQVDCIPVDVPVKPPNTRLSIEASYFACTGHMPLFGIMYSKPFEVMYPRMCIGVCKTERSVHVGQRQELRGPFLGVSLSRVPLSYCFKVHRKENQLFGGPPKK